MKIHEMSLLMSLGVGASAFAFEMPAQFTGTTDEGYAVGCVQQKSDPWFDIRFKHDFYACRFREGADVLRAIDAIHPDSDLKCQVGTTGSFEGCDTDGLPLEARFFIKSDKVSSGLISCQTYLLKMFDPEQLYCFEAYNPDAGLFGTGKNGHRIVDCRGDENLHVAIDQLRDDVVSDEGYNGNLDLWLKGDFVMESYNEHSRFLAQAGGPVFQRSGKNSPWVFVSRDGQVSLRLSETPSSSNSAQPVTATYHYQTDRKLSCVVHP